MKSHKVCVITCPHCGTEKPITHMETRCVLTYQCKSCKQVTSAQVHQECFVFDGLVATNNA